LCVGYVTVISLSVYLQVANWCVQFTVVGCDRMQEEVGIETDEDAGVVIPDL